MNQLARNDYLHLFFDNEDITQKTGFYLMTMEKDTEFNVGLNRNINTTDSVFGKKLFLGTNNDSFNFEVTLIKAREVNNDFIAEEIHKEDIENLCRYIIKNEPKAIEKDDKLYYGIFTTATGKFYSNNNGYITFKFVMTEPYIYSKEIVKDFDTSINNEVELKNDTDLIDEETFIDIEFNSNFFNLFNKYNSVQGYLLSDGTIKEITNVKTSNYIDISNKKDLHTNATRFASWYDSNKNFISFLGENSESIELDLSKKPSNAKYIRFSYNTWDEDKIMLVNGDLPNEYISFVEETPLIIKNINNNSCIKLDNLMSGHNYKIYGEEMQIVDITNPKEIIYSPKFIYLDYKPNIIKIECNARIIGNIKYQIKYGIK